MSQFPPASPARGAAALLLLTLLLYVNSLGGGFILDDEYVYAADSPLLAHGVRDAFTHDFFTLLGNKFEGMYYYRPLLALAHIWLGRLTHVQPFALHLASVLLHAGAGIMVFLLLREYLEARLAWLAAALFVAHPLHVEAVSWLAAINEPEAGLFMLLSLYLLARAHRGKGRIADCGLRIADFNPKTAGHEDSKARRQEERPEDSSCLRVFGPSCEGSRRQPRIRNMQVLLLLLSCLAAAAAYLTKESAMVLPLMAAIFVGWRAWPLAATAVGTLLLRYIEIGLATARLPHRTVGANLTTVTSAFALYVRNTLLPWPLAAEYDLRRSLACWLVIGAVCALMGWLAARHRRFRAALLLFLIPLAPAVAASPALPLLRQAQDRYAYMPVLGMAFGIAAYATTRTRFRFAVALLVAWLAVSSVVIPYWRDSERLWTHTLAVTPNSRNAVIALGEWYFSTGQLHEAAQIYAYGLTVRPNDPDYHASAAAVQRAIERQRSR